MAKVQIELDLAVVQKAIKAEVKPAVAAILAQRYDIKAMIAEELLREPAKSDKDGSDMYSWHMTRMLGYGGAPPQRGQAAVEGMVRAAISEAAQEYIKVAVDEQRDAIYAAFRKMMAASPDRLVNAFVEMIEGADIEFDLATTLSIKEPERSYGD